MSLETRRSSTYYYEARRVGKKVVKRYVGGGPFAVAAAWLDRHDAQLERDEYSALRYSWEASESLVVTLSNSLVLSASTSLQASGYHYHRGAWRKRRIVSSLKTMTPAQMAALGLTEESPRPSAGRRGATRLLSEGGEVTGQGCTLTVPGSPSSLPETAEERLQMVQDALEAGDQEMITRAVEILRQYPDNFKADFSEVGVLVDTLATNPILAQLYRNEVNRLRRELYEGRKVDAIPYAERLLIDNVIACRLSLVHTSKHMKTSGSLPLIEFCDRKLDRATRRYQKALETLARVRRLALPLVVRLEAGNMDGGRASSPTTSFTRSASALDSVLDDLPASSRVPALR